ncbi:hypothetical protein [Brevibacterium moorei]|nr:hypothetical protein [Brevibacterium sp. 68QC2CO]MCQ9384485.1 hypothetical protein [Brevibacterium sp. 68QC2CO]
MAGSASDLIQWSRLADARISAAPVRHKDRTSLVFILADSIADCLSSIDLIIKDRSEGRIVARVPASLDSYRNRIVEVPDDVLPKTDSSTIYDFFADLRSGAGEEAVSAEVRVSSPSEGFLKSINGACQMEYYSTKWHNLSLNVKSSEANEKNVMSKLGRGLRKLTRNGR